MDQFRWIDHTQPGRLVQGTQMLYISAAFNLFNAFIIAGSFSLVYLVIALLKAGGGYGIANEKKIGFYAAVVGVSLGLLLNLFILTVSPVFGLIGVGISAWILSLVLHDTSRSYARIWFK